MIDPLKMSVPAVCGISEREVTVAAKNVEAQITKLKNVGFHVIGTSLPGRVTRKIWFIRSGSL